MSMNEKYEQIGVAVTCRGYEEYVRMFALHEEQLISGEVLDVAAGASSLTADLSARGVRSVAADPRYARHPEVLVQEAREEIETSTNKLRGLTHRFDFSYYGDMDRHRAMREASLARFSADYAGAYGSERYTDASLPSLPFAHDRFDLVLCSHFLFLYGDQFDYSFHEQAVLELLRVCKPGGEVRIYPLITLAFQPYPQLDELLAAAARTGASIRMEPTSLPFIPVSTQVLILGKTAADH
jgi:SAM-dependent methyltransferase